MAFNPSELAAQITVAALSNDDTGFVTHPDKVADFYETIYKKVLLTREAAQKGQITSD